MLIWIFQLSHYRRCWMCLICLFWLHWHRWLNMEGIFFGEHGRWSGKWIFKSSIDKIICYWLELNSMAAAWGRYDINKNGSIEIALYLVLLPYEKIHLAAIHWLFFFTRFRNSIAWCSISLARNIVSMLSCIICSRWRTASRNFGAAM